MGLIDWFWHRFQVSGEGPLTAYDRRLGDLDRRGAELRQAAAALLAARQDLEEQRAHAMRAGRARSSGLPDGQGTERERARELESALARVAGEAASLRAAAEALGIEAEALRRERATAAALCKSASEDAPAPSPGEEPQGVEPLPEEPGVQARPHPRD